MVPREVVVELTSIADVVCDLRQNSRRPDSDPVIVVDEYIICVEKP